MSKWIPSAPEVSREALVVIAGALIAAWIIGQSPPVRDWIKKQWGGALPPDPGSINYPGLNG
jgi:hypothetical protein